MIMAGGETEVYWSICAAAAAARAAEPIDMEELKLCADDLDVIAIYTTNNSLRRQARALSNQIQQLLQTEGRAECAS